VSVHCYVLIAKLHVSNKSEETRNSGTIIEYSKILHARQCFVVAPENLFVGAEP